MPEKKEHVIKAGEPGQELELSLWQMPNPKGVPVLLLHGASANHETFLNPGGSDEGGKPRALANWLHKEGYEPWLLDWRGNGLHKDGVFDEFRDHLDFDNTANFDIPKALEKIHQVSKPKQVCAVGHCMGAATLAQSIAAGRIEARHKLNRVVLLTIGLFYEAAPNGKLKSMDAALEEMRTNRGGLLAIDPRPKLEWPNELWPSEIDRLYENFPEVRPHPKPANAAEEMCNRVSFMFGQPYRESNLHAEVHSGDYLRKQFGSIPFRMYLQGARNVSRRCAASFNARRDDHSLIDRPSRENFMARERVTLITGQKNEIWHRDSIDRMYEWLGPAKCEKHVLPEYAHQDLLWGAHAYRDVFALIQAGLPSPRE